MHRRNRWLPLLLAVLLVFVPGVSNAGVGVSFDLISFGPFSIGIDIPFGPAIILLGGALFLDAVFTSFFDANSGSSSYVASYSGPQRTSTRVRIKPGDEIPARVLRIRFPDLITDPSLPLPGGGDLHLQSDGKFIFRGTDFKGHVYVHYDNSMTVWDDSGAPVLLIRSRAGQTFIVQERSARAPHVLSLLLGLPKPGGSR